MSEAITDATLPYVVSADVECLTRRWASQVNLNLPDNGFFRELQTELCHNLSNFTRTRVDIIPDKVLIEGLSGLMDNTSIEKISLDRAYTEGSLNVSGYVDATRAVDQDFKSITDLTPRPGSKSVIDQIATFRKESREPICLVDDVVFDGDTMLKMVEHFAEIGRPVVKVIAGIGISKGIKKIEKTELK